MSNEYLRKSVADRRTGANLIGVHVDTGNMGNLSPDFTQAFNQLETFAKQSDELKIQNEKKKIQLDIAAKRIKFKTDYLNDPSVYASQEKWDKTTALYEADREEAKQMIADSKYLNKEERIMMSKSIDIDYKKDWLDPLNKRNGVVIRERVDEATTLLQTAINNASVDDLYKTDTIENFISTATEIYDPLMKLGISTKGDMNAAIIKGISTIEGARLERKAGTELLYNPLLSVEQKAEEIKKAMGTLSDDKRISEIADSMSKEYDFDDYEKEYLKSSLKIQYKKAEEGLNKQLYNLGKAQKRIEAQEKRNLVQANTVRKAINSNDTFKLTQLKTGVPYNSKNMLDDESNMETIYGKGVDIETLGNKSDWRVAKVLDEDTIDSIRKNKAILDKTSSNGTLNYITTIYSKADELSMGDESKRNMVIKDAAIQLGLDPNIVLNYEENSRYLTVGDYLKKGQNVNLGIDTETQDLETGIRAIFDRKTEEKYLRLFNELGGDDRAYEVLNNYISGYIRVEADEYKRTYEKMPVSAIQAVFRNKDIFTQIESDIPILKNIAVAPIKYDYAPIEIKNFGIDELIFEEREFENTKDTEDEYYSF